MLPRSKKELKLRNKSSRKNKKRFEKTNNLRESKLKILKKQLKLIRTFCKEIW